MGCVSSTLLSHPDDDFTQATCSTTFRHHIVSLTSSTYGLLTLDPPPPSSVHFSPTTAPTPPRFPDLPTSPLKPEIINSLELMSNLNSTPPPPNLSFRISSLPLNPNKENSNPNLTRPRTHPSIKNHPLNKFEKISPPNSVNKVIIYTTTLRAVRKTFEACNTVRSAFENLLVTVTERDISMHKGFKDELQEILKGKETSELTLPRVFINGRYIGGVDEVTRIVEEEEGGLEDLVQGLPKVNKGGYVCDGCGGARFLPCFKCNGSCKLVVEEESENEVNSEEEKSQVVVIRCSECNENGLVLCPICS